MFLILLFILFLQISFFLRYLQHYYFKKSKTNLSIKNIFMKTLKITFSLLLVFILLSGKIKAQQTSDQPLIDKISIGANFGSLLAYGDIKEYDFWPAPEERKWGFGGILNYQISSIFSIQAQGLMGNIAGIKRKFTNGKPANLKFEASMYEGSLNATVSLNRWWAPNLKINEKLNFYAMAGVGLMNFRTQLRDLNTDKLIKEYGWDNADPSKKDKMTTETTFPVGLGVKYRAAKKLDIVLETQLRNVYSDKMDAFVRPYNHDDKYGYTYIGISYRLGKQEKHMEWLTPDEETPQSDKLALDETNKKLDELSKKLADLESKSSTPTGPNDPRFDELNQRIDDLTNKVKELENRPVTYTTTTEGVVTPTVDLSKLDELNQKLADLDNKNNDLANRLVNMQTTTNVTYDGGRPILVSVFFEVNKSTIDKPNSERVASAAKYLLSNPGARLELVGHADKTGGQKYNELLSERRAKAVLKSLTDDYGIDASRLSISYKGYTEPLSKSNYDVNRRVDFLIK